MRSLHAGAERSPRSATPDLLAQKIDRGSGAALEDSLCPGVEALKFADPRTLHFGSNLRKRAKLGERSVIQLALTLEIASISREI